MAEVVLKSIVDRVFLASRSALPWTVHSELLLAAPVDLARARAAATTTMRTHPLLSAAHESEEAWLVPDEPREPIVTTADVADHELPSMRAHLVSRPFDLARDPAVRFHLLVHEGSTRLIVVADHALVDGVAIRHLTKTFTDALGGVDFAGRDDSWRVAHQLDVVDLPEQLVGNAIEEMRKRVRGTPVRVCGEGGSEGGDQGVAYRSFGREASTALATAPVAGATANDALVASICVGSMSWNNSRRARALPFGISVPVNLRPLRAWLDGVCNATLAWPLRIDSEHPRAVVETVASQLRAVRAGVASRSVRAMLQHLKYRRQLPAWVSHGLASSTLVSTVPRATIDGSPMLGGAPAPRVMGIAFAVSASDAGHVLSARYHRSRFSAEAVDELLDFVVAAVPRVYGSED